MNEAASQAPRKPNLGNTGQYTISVSKPGTGEDLEKDLDPLHLEVPLKVAFHAKADSGTTKPIACRVVVKSDDNNTLSDKKFKFDDSMVAHVIIKLGESWQHTWWADLYLDYGTAHKDEYAISAYLSTLILNNMTVSCSYRSDSPSDGRDG